MAEFGVKEAEALLGKVFAPWIIDLGLRPVSFDGGGGTFVLPENPRFVHGGGVVCGQTISAAADTATVVTLSAQNGRFRVCTTVDLATHFIRPIPPGDVDIRVEVLSNGKRMAFTRVEFRSAGSSKLAASATCAFAYLED